MISLIAAQTSDGIIGANGALPWRKLKADMERFKAVTAGHPVVMGRKTWESLPERFRPLPGRSNIVISRDPSYVAPGALAFTSLKEALDQASGLPGGEETFVIGGAELYRQALPLAEKIYLTDVEAHLPGDVHFPEINGFEWKEVSRQPFAADEDTEYPGFFIEYLRNHA